MANETTGTERKGGRAKIETTADLKRQIARAVVAVNKATARLHELGAHPSVVMSPAVGTWVQGKVQPGIDRMNTRLSDPPQERGEGAPSTSSNPADELFGELEGVGETDAAE